ncbi:MAG TPA: peptide chain release factor 2 [Candidatus Bipolaricaulis anaerobius]|uniref:Peptide chain release factor 2 n=1 Tax=Candidatus Bipolaricaulis anaerobius TaxID=2026885 RepID=A0A2X3L196_9BACT|nr:peptide chain release factor 2 [Candidatus Bipolaricaulis anaerobius]MBP7725942.1 peptide chain release factor 2 [Candidatus Bipolaricaulis sp.]SQD92550.1 Peptide chain release factor 2 [Candidatus Bipolaricaulis anaerobius]HNR24994.1 peptide chain release factor 2 [Candidatus Bipolaricaulis anaerobius]HNS24347.1 peptide chain release factor 2 [Candidatus Bipolaricaulis anaerobius]
MNEHLRDLRDRIERLGQSLGADALRAKVKAIEEEMARPGFWEDRATAQGKVRELEAAKDRLGGYDHLTAALDEVEVLFEVAEEEGDAGAQAEAEEALAKLAEEMERVRIQLLLSGPYDGNDCFLALNAGAGGTDAQDWTEMLLRMYTRFCERAGFAVRLVDETPGEEAGLKSATLEVKGRRAYGLLKGESGVHRLVRISPFDSQARRHTSFASVTATPVVPEDDLVISEDDLRIDSFRAGGPGGQHMQKNETAVRITHLPTGIVVGCQNERSQLQNKLTALRILRARLRALMEQEHARKIEELRGELADIEWGHQIRSYVLQPYQLVKDHRTGVEVGNVQAVLDGDLWPFIWASLEAGQASQKA